MKASKVNRHLDLCLSGQKDPSVITIDDDDEDDDFQGSSNSTRNKEAKNAAPLWQKGSTSRARKVVEVVVSER
jgi:hypothetical protein